MVIETTDSPTFEPGQKVIFTDILFPCAKTVESFAAEEGLVVIRNRFGHLTRPAQAVKEVPDDWQDPPIWEGSTLRDPTDWYERRLTHLSLMLKWLRTSLARVVPEDEIAWREVQAIDAIHSVTELLDEELAKAA